MGFRGRIRLAQLDEIDTWLNSLGLSNLDRIRVYRRNLQKMIAAHDRGELEELQQVIEYDEAREIFWSYVDADEFVRAVGALRESLGDDVAAAPIERALKGPADLFLENPNNSDGRNFMFELITAARFAAAGFRPSFDQGPDVQVDFAGLRVAIQCKRP